MTPAAAGRLKRLAWLLFVPLALGASLLLLRAASELYAYLTKAAVVDSALNLVEPRRAAAGRLLWLPDRQTPRLLEPFVRDQITSDYLLGFEELTYGAVTGDGAGLRSYFQGAALADTQLAVARPGGRFVTWDHRLELGFYAPDGATAAFTDSYRYAQGVGTAPDFEGLRVAERSVEVMMTLDDGTWRVRRWQVLTDAVDPGSPQTQSGLAARLGAVRGINYTPRSAPFDAFWNAFDATEVAADLATVRSLGLNTVRFFLPYPAPEGLAADLAQLLDLAQAQGLDLIPTLLDGYTRYAPEDLPEVDRYLVELSELLRHPNVLIVDVKNEADRDFASAGVQRVRSFLTYVLTRTRSLSGKPVLVGTAEPDAVLAAAADAVALHHYGPADAVEQRIARAGAFGRPVLLQEFGFHSWRLKVPDPHTEAEQAWYFRQVLDSAVGTGWLGWTLYDLPRGAVPGGRSVERHLGVLAADGREKAAAGVLMDATVAPPTWTDRIGKIAPFLAGVLLAAAAVLVLALRLRPFLGRRTPASVGAHR